MPHLALRSGGRACTVVHKRMQVVAAKITAQGPRGSTRQKKDVGEERERGRGQEQRKGERTHKPPKQHFFAQTLIFQEEGKRGEEKEQGRKRKKRKEKHGRKRKGGARTKSLAECDNWLMGSGTPNMNKLDHRTRGRRAVGWRKRECKLET